MKILNKILIGIFILIFIFTGTGFIIGFFYGEEVKHFIINEINKNLATSVSTKEIDFSVIRKFPNASVEFKEVVFFSNDDTTDEPLLNARSVFLQFNIIDIIKKNYRIRKVHFYEPVMNLRIDKKGNDNYHFWKQVSRDDGRKESFAFELKEVVFENANVTYIDHKQNYDVAFAANELKFSGIFSGDEKSFFFDYDLHLRHCSAGADTYLKNINLEGTLNLYVKGNSYVIKKGRIISSGNTVSLSGKIDYNDNNKGLNVYMLDLKVKGDKLDINDIISRLPDKQQKRLSGYTISGKANIEMTLTGKHPNAHLDARFDINSGSLKNDSSGFGLNKIELTGSISNGKRNNLRSSYADVQKFNLFFGNDPISGAFRVADFEEPVISADISASFNLEELFRQKIFHPDTLESISGNLYLETSVKGKLKALNDYSAHEIQSIKATGSSKANNVKFIVKGNPLEFKNINGSFNFSDKAVIVESLTGNISGTDFDLKGHFKNLMSYFLFAGEELSVVADLKSDNINLNELLSDNSDDNKNENSYAIGFPENVRIKLDVDLAQLNFRRVAAKKITGKVMLIDKQFMAGDLSLSLAGGSALLNGLIDASIEKNVLITCEAKIKNIDIHKLFYEFEDFGQSVISHKHLKGVATSDILFASVWDKELNIDLDKIYTKAKITVNKGELINYAPMMRLAEYIAVSELKHIKFSTLENEIEIKNQKVYIPKMEINSSALNITVSGDHSFKNDIDYRFRVYLPELQAKKAKKARKENDEFGVVQDDGMGMNIFLSMTGTVDNPKIKYDKQGWVSRLKEDIKEEKQTLKSVLNKEFGWFKNDSTINNDNKKKEKTKDDYFIMEWDENDDEQPQ